MTEQERLKTDTVFVDTAPLLSKTATLSNPAQ